MSVFGSIVSAIFGSKHAAGVTPDSWDVFIDGDVRACGDWRRPWNVRQLERRQSRSHAPTSKPSSRNSTTIRTKISNGESRSPI